MLKAPVIAEGIETRAHLDFMRNEACDETQGYFLGRPMPGGLMFPQTAAKTAGFTGLESEPAVPLVAEAAAAAG
jgi:EAL domain-containing protein (putative c-di-GMP-specific phosphodiesterase class I)